MRLRLLSLLLPGVLLIVPGMGLAEYIACPLDEIETDVTTRKPSEWWSTPQVGRLQATNIIWMGDRPVLLCNYGVGSVMREAPPDSDCRAVARGFRCEPQSVASQGGITGTAVETAGPMPDEPPAGVPSGASKPAPSGLSGRARLAQTFMMDLDSGRTRNTGKKADIWFNARTARSMFIKPVNGAMLAVVPRSQANLSGCLGGRFSKTRSVPLSRVGPDSGNCMCVYTNDPGTLAAVCVDGISEERGRKVLELSFDRWYN